MKYLIIGGVAGGATAATRIRRIDEKAQIIIFEKGEYISYANCGLPYYIGGIIQEKDSLIVATPEYFKSRYNIDVRVNNEVLKIDRKNKKIIVNDKIKKIEYIESYDKLLLSPGAIPISLKVMDSIKEKVFTLRDVTDAENIIKFIIKNKPDNAVIIGGGFIGLEMAECLQNRGISISIVEMAEHLIPMLDLEMAVIIQEYIRSKNIKIYIGSALTEIKEENSKIKLILKNKKEIITDMAIIAIGVSPDTKLASEAGLVIGEKRGIYVDEYMQTSDKDIFAVGDAVEVWNPILEEKVLIPLAGPANKQARIAADNMVYGKKESYIGTIGTSIVKIFNLTVGFTGYSEKVFKTKKKEFIPLIIHDWSHATYYPGAVPVTIKILFSKTEGQILGAQVIGKKGIDKIIEILSLMCQFKMNVRELKNLEQAYSPPYSSVRSSLNILGDMAENILTGKLKVISWQELEEMKKEDIFILDVRETEEFMEGKIQGAVNIPLSQLRDRINEIPENKKILTYCEVGQRTYFADRILIQNNYKEVYNLSGGYKTWNSIEKMGGKNE